MPFDVETFSAQAVAASPLAMIVISLLPPEEQGPAATGLLGNCMTEALVAMMFKIEPETLKKWRTAGNGPPRTTEGNVVLFPIPLLKNYLMDRARGAHASQRPPRR